MAISSAETASYLLMALTHDSHSHSQSPSDGSGSGGAGDSEDSQTGGRRRRPPRQKINARERYRTFNVNAAYEALRSMIPTEPINRKLSKIEIIRLASSYINHLSSTLQAGTDFQPCLLHKYENEGGGAGGHTRRISICTFCLKSK
ncbi:basic helix-loop-helix transcription factor scleraxis [Drosophila miranda]|uniref:basic helix-loop-helix transcription factor scleraxis n=1 Tax=Drosophila miranda TaxID=7229 RepID=UPI0007E76092|nr:basic helix-loop-helix transcription factor scleraxis [Drosophila miranda]